MTQCTHGFTKDRRSNRGEKPTRTLHIIHTHKHSHVHEFPRRNGKGEEGRGRGGGGGKKGGGEGGWTFYRGFWREKKKNVATPV